MENFKVLKTMTIKMLSILYNTTLEKMNDFVFHVHRSSDELFKY